MMKLSVIIPAYNEARRIESCLHHLNAGLRTHPPVTSIRKIELYGWKEVIVLLLRWLVLRRRTTRDKKYLRLFYDGRR